MENQSPQSPPTKILIKAKKLRDLVSRTIDQNLSIAMNYSNSLDDARQIVIRAYSKMARKLHQLEKSKEPDFWAQKYVARSCIQHTVRNKWLRKIAPPQHVAEEALIDVNPQDEEGMASAFQRELFSALQNLKRWQRLIFVLRFYEGMKVKEIARVIDQPERKVKKLLLDSVERIRRGKN